MPSGEPGREDPAPLTVFIRFELLVLIRVDKLLATGFGLSRPAVRAMAGSGRIRLPMTIDAKARDDFTLFVITTPPLNRESAPGSYPRPASPARARCPRCPLRRSDQATDACDVSSPRSAERP